MQNYVNVLFSEILASLADDKTTVIRESTVMFHYCGGSNVVDRSYL